MKIQTPGLLEILKITVRSFFKRNPVFFSLSFCRYLGNDNFVLLVRNLWSLRLVPAGCGARASCRPRQGAPLCKIHSGG